MVRIKHPQVELSCFRTVRADEVVKLFLGDGAFGDPIECVGRELREQIGSCSTHDIEILGLPAAKAG